MPASFKIKAVAVLMTLLMSSLAGAQRPAPKTKPAQQPAPKTQAAEQPAPKTQAAEQPSREDLKQFEQQSAVVHHHYYGGAAPGYAYGGGAPMGGYGGGYGGGGGMTAALGAGVGAGYAAAGAGKLREDTAVAAGIYAQTAHQVIQNHNYATTSFYADREVHEAYVDAHRDPQVTPEEADKIAHKAEPGRLSSAQFDRQTKVINWPALLREPEFASPREALDQLFNARTPANSGTESENYGQIKTQCAVMKGQLVSKLRADNLPSVTFIGAEHFIKSLAYEGRFTVQ